jgi:hypothetical protein
MMPRVLTVPGQLRYFAQITGLAALYFESITVPTSIAE